MRFSLVLAALLCFTTWMSMVHATHGPVSNCLCLRTSNTRPRLGNIVNYTIQSEGICPKAIIFKMKSGFRLCSDPDRGWAKKAMLKLDEENKKQALEEKGQNEDGSTGDITPAASNTSKKTPQKKGRNGRRRQRKKSRRGKKGLRIRV